MMAGLRGFGLPPVGLSSFNRFTKRLSEGETLAGMPVSASGYLGSYRNPDTGSPGLPVGQRAFEDWRGAENSPGLASDDCVLWNGRYECSADPSQSDSGTIEVIKFSIYLADGLVVDETRIGTTREPAVRPREEPSLRSANQMLF